MAYRFRRVILIVGALLTPLLAGTPAAAIPFFFSIDAPSPSLPGPGLTASDVFASFGPIGGPPVLVIPAGGLGLVGPPFDELNAMAVGSPGFMGQLHFSVDRLSAGAAPSYAPSALSEAAVGQAAGDIYVTGNVTAAVRLPLNSLAFNQDLNGLLPAILPGVVAVPPIDDLDALHLDSALVIPTLFAMLPGHPYLGAGGFFGCGGDLFVPIGGGPPGPAFPFAALGLAACADDVDALEFDLVTGDIWYSLAPGSPSLAPLSPIVGCAAGCSAADLFIAPGGGGIGFLAAPAAALGLAATDNLNALSADSCVTLIGSDTDGDGVDDGCDNCTFVANPSQYDADVDGYGNICDGDFDGSGVVGVPDFGIFKAAFGSALGAATYVPAVDADEDGVIGILDFGAFKSGFGGAPGLSSLACAGAPPCTHSP